MAEAFSTSAPKAQHVQPRFVPGHDCTGHTHVLPPPYLPQRGVRTTSRPVARRPKLLDQVRAALRLRHYSLPTEDTSLHWIPRCMLFHGPQPQPPRSARGQREQRSYHEVTSCGESAAGRASRTSPGTAATRPHPRLRRCVFARRIVPEIPSGTQTLGLALGVSRAPDFRRSAVWRTPTPSSARGRPATRSPRRWGQVGRIKPVGCHTLHHSFATPPL